MTDLSKMISSSSRKSSPSKLVSTTKKTSPSKQKDESDSPAFRKMRERFFTEAVAEALNVKVNLRKSNDMEQVYSTRIGGIYFDFIRTSDSFFFKFGSGFYRAGLNIKNNPHAKDPTWQKLFEFVEADSTKYRKYEKDKFVCGDFAEMFHNRAETIGIRCGLVTWKQKNGENHALNFVNTTNGGPFFIDIIIGHFGVYTQDEFWKHVVENLDKGDAVSVYI